MKNAVVVNPAGFGLLTPCRRVTDSCWVQHVYGGLIDRSATLVWYRTSVQDGR